MKNQYFLKDKKAQVYILRETMDSMGGYEEAYYPIAAAPVWCFSKQNSQNLKFTDGGLTLNDEERLFVFNYNDLIVQGVHVLYKNDWYEIRRIDTRNDYNTDIFAYGSIVPKPADGDIKEYDKTKI